MFFAPHSHLAVASRRPAARHPLAALLPGLSLALLGACTLTTDDYEPAIASASESASPVCTSDPCRGEDSGAVTGSQSAVLPLVGSDATRLDTLTPGVGAASGALGWAGVAGLGVAGTTGGGTAELVIAHSAAELSELAARPEPLLIGVAGSIELPLLSLTSNKTLLGLGGDATLHGGIRVRGLADAFVSNVIIRNLHVDATASDADGDAIELRYAHHVWIDHCEVTDAADGLVDIVHGSDFVTLSFNRFSYTADAPVPEHRFANLIGDSVTNGDEDARHLNVTLYDNHFGDGVLQASLARFGVVHYFNNYFASPRNQSVIVAGLSARLLVENNYFEGVAAPHALLRFSAARLTAPGNIYEATTGARDVTASSFVPAYAYELEPASSVRDSVLREAGPH